MRPSLFKVLKRSFLIQGSWNYEGMQNIGFLYAMAPVIRELSGDGEVPSKALKRHIEFFNTHPYMASSILGVTASMEYERGEEGREEEGEAITMMKETLSGPLAALGDGFFWSSLKPLTSITAVVAGFMGSIMAPILFLLLYNSFHLWMRIMGFLVGMKKKSGIITFIEELKLPQTTKRLKYYIPVLLGILISGLLFFAPSLLSESVIWNIRFLLILPVILLMIIPKKGKGRGKGVILNIYAFSFLLIIGFYICG